MTPEESRRLKAQQESQAAQIQRLNMQVQAQQARRHDEEDQQIPPQQQVPPQQAPQYNQVNQDQMILQGIINQAAQQAANQAQANMEASQDVGNKVKMRMERLVEQYPALKQEDSGLVIKARDIYQRITTENPSLDEASKYELAVREAASFIGARPVNAPIEDFASPDYVMPAGRNPALGNTKSSKSRLTQGIINNAKAMNINVDPSTPDGKKNLAELSEYSARFNADQDETQFRYK